MRHSIGLYFFLAALVGAHSASGLILDPAVIPLAPEPGSGFDPGISGELRLLAVTAGLPSGGIVLTGSVEVGDVTLVFEVENTASVAFSALHTDAIHPASLDPVGHAGVFYTGFGWIPGAGVDFVAALIASDLASGVFDGTLDPGETSDAFFVSIPALAPGTPFAGALSEVGQYAVGLATVVAEPEEALLALVGVVGLARLRRLRL
jgi:hypothetical protein